MTSLHGKHLLVVDDEPLLRDILRCEFESFGAQVDEAENGLVALEMIKKGRYDAVLADVRMPEGDGITLAKLILGLETRPRVFLCTGDAGKDFCSEAAEFGVLAVFAKPFDLDDITARICELVLGATP
jgi:CheY-like chemotaxis protein